jgi:hypothetical protein
MNIKQSEKLASIKGIVHGYADRHAGAHLTQIGERFNLSKVAQLKQIHSGDVIILDEIESHNDSREGDALVTRLKGIAIGIRTADCVPILIADKKSSVIAAVHAGWRGTYLEVAVNTINLIQSEYGIAPSELTAVIGPSIKKCCYEVGEDVARLFRDKFDDKDQFLSQNGQSKYLLDLRLANKLGLQKAGVGDVELLDICTKCDDNFYSYRREGKGVNTQLSFIALTP